MLNITLNRILQTLTLTLNDQKYFEKKMKNVYK